MFKFKVFSTIGSVALLTLSLASPIQASNQKLTLGSPGYGGNGCPAGSVSATVSPDQKSLSLLFDEYVVEAGGDTGKKLARKSCNIAIPVHVPQGFMVSVFKIDYRGYVYQPKGAKTNFSVEYFFAGKKGPKFKKTFKGAKDKDYLIRNKLKARSVVWSACGADVNLRVNSSIKVKTNKRKEEALATVDSADVKSGIKYHLKWKRC